MKVTEYIVEVHDTATGDRYVYIASGLDDLRDWLENAVTHEDDLGVGEKKVVEHIMGEVRRQGHTEYDSDEIYDDQQTYGLTQDEMDDVVDNLDQIRLKIESRTLDVGAPEAVLRALHKINVRRARIGQPALDPIESNWSVDDVFKEASRIP